MADTAAVDVVFGDAGRDATEAADDGYIVSAADLNVIKLKYSHRYMIAFVGEDAAHSQFFCYHATTHDGLLRV